MKSKTIKNVFIASTLVVAMGTAQAELTSIQKQVIADQQTMEGMNADQRRDFRKQIFGNSDKVAQRAYNRTYKELAAAKLLPQLTNVGMPSKSIVASRAVGTNITYDSGTVETTNQGIASQSIGNKFNTGWNPDAGAMGALNPVLATGSVTQATVSMAAVSGSAAFLTIINGTASGGTIVDSSSTPLSVGMNTVPIGPFATSGPFMGSIWQNAGGTAATGDIVAVATGTVNGQGYHGVSFNDLNVTAVTDIAGKNAVFRLSGQLLQDSVPVELMNFSVE